MQTKTRLTRLLPWLLPITMTLAATVVMWLNRGAIGTPRAFPYIITGGMFLGSILIMVLGLLFLLNPKKRP